LKTDGVTIVTIGLGNLQTVDLNELQMIASSPDNAFVRDKDSVDDNLLYITKKMICGGNTCLTFSLFY